MPDTLAPYQPSAEKPWNEQRVQHLYARLGFGAGHHTVNAGLSLSPQALADQLLDGAANLPDPDAPYWANWAYDDYPDDDMQTYFEVKSAFFRRWIQEMATESVRAKLALFWHNHFVTRENDYFCNSFMWHYYDLLHRRAFGNFRTFVEEMGIDPAMLTFLNGNQNIAEQPNENYARELMELFTMGEGNGYTQNDIVEVARALTGWRVNMYSCDPTVTFDPNLYDNTTKTIFGHGGNWGYDDVHELIFTLRSEEVANYICSKLYRFYVYEEPDPVIVQGMAQTFRDNNWEIMPVLRQLFHSEHFYEQRFINARVRSPLEALVGVIRRAGGIWEEDYNEDLIGYLTFLSGNLGQEVFNPVDVAGWPEHHSWLTENTLTARWSGCENVLYSMTGSQAFLDRLRDMAIDRVGLEETDPAVITQSLATLFLNRPLEGRLLEVATLYFKGDVPDNYFEDGTWSLYYGAVPWQIVNLFVHLVRLPEWQLN